MPGKHGGMVRRGVGGGNGNRWVGAGALLAGEVARVAKGSHVATVVAGGIVEHSPLDGGGGRIGTAREEGTYKYVAAIGIRRPDS